MKLIIATEYKNIPCSLRAQRTDSRQEPWLKPRMPEIKGKSFSFHNRYHKCQY